MLIHNIIVTFLVEIVNKKCKKILKKMIKFIINGKIVISAPRLLIWGLLTQAANNKALNLLLTLRAHKMFISCLLVCNSNCCTAECEINIHTLQVSSIVCVNYRFISIIINVNVNSYYGRICQSSVASADANRCIMLSR